MNNYVIAVLKKIVAMSRKWRWPTQAAMGTCVTQNLIFDYKNSNEIIAFFFPFYWIIAKYIWAKFEKKLLKLLEICKSTIILTCHWHCSWSVRC